MRADELYTYRVAWSEEDGEHVGTCAEFPSLSWLDANPNAALAGIRKLVASCIRDLASKRQSVPDPISKKRFSGKFMVRVPPQLHRELAVQAAESGVSLNRFVAHKLAKA